MNNKEALEVLLNNYKSGKLRRVVKEYGAWVISGVEMKKLSRVYKAVGLGDTRNFITGHSYLPTEKAFMFLAPKGEDMDISHNLFGTFDMRAVMEKAGTRIYFIR